MDEEGKTVSYYNSTDFSLVESLNINLPQGYTLHRVTKIPMGLYKNDNNEYFLVQSANNNGRNLDVYVRSGNNLNLDISICSGYFNLRYDIASNGSKIYLVLLSHDAQYKIYSFLGSYSATNEEVKMDNHEIKPYPNPCRDKIHLTFDVVKNVSSIKICDINGKMIDRIPVGNNATEYVLDVHSYPEGVYFYEINGKSQSFIVK
ncbi:MAG: T9SS type A sorting domain-containing protein [Paludibacteraceae bacterium]|nr:T9SS type A sorting domain-containing protein [Paludibacteraceae bacterium]